MNSRRVRCHGNQERAWKPESWAAGRSTRKRVEIGNMDVLSVTSKGPVSLLTSWVQFVYLLKKQGRGRRENCLQAFFKTEPFFLKYIMKRSPRYENKVRAAVVEAGTSRPCLVPSRAPWREDPKWLGWKVSKGLFGQENLSGKVWVAHWLGTSLLVPWRVQHPRITGRHAWELL